MHFVTISFNVVSFHMKFDTESEMKRGSYSDQNLLSHAYKHLNTVLRPA